MAEQVATKKLDSIFKPIIVLVSIALVASFMLAGVYMMTEPIITQREIDTMNQALIAVLPDASSFTELTDVELVTGVSQVYKADNGAGIVCTTVCKSEQGGTIKMMIGINAQGAVNGISVISHNETAGLGDKALAQDYLQNYFGTNSTEAVDGVNAMSGVTKTSNCIKESCKVAIEMFNKVSMF